MASRLFASSSLLDAARVAPRFGLRANWKQFTLLVLINAFVGGMVGLERTVAPLIGAALISVTYDQFPRRVVLVPFDMAALFLIVVIICLISSFWGVRTALKVDPAVAWGT